MADGAWRPDPGGRHEYRWWDGERWTDLVADAGQTSADPLPSPTGPDSTPPVTHDPAATWADPSGGASTTAPLASWHDPHTPVWGPAPAAGTYPSYPSYGQPQVVVPTTNGLAIASLVLGILWIYWIGSVLAVVFGHVALRQCRQHPEHYSGRGLAVAGLVLGYIGVGTLVLFLILMLASLATL